MKKTIRLENESEDIEPLMKSGRVAIIPYGGGYRIAFKSCMKYWFLIKPERENECGASTRMLNFLAKKRKELER